MESWVKDQVLNSFSTFDNEMESSDYTADVNNYFDRVCLDCNYLDAVKDLEWSKYIPEKANVLDLAGGTGWLTALLSSFDFVSKVKIVDLSKKYLEVNMPVSVERLSGDISKITPVEGLFSPLLCDDNSFDAVTVSSSLHHAENLEKVINEIQRVLKPGGYCLIVNETPVGNTRYYRSIFGSFLKILMSTIFKKYSAVSPSISASGYLYDPVLGDRMYPDWFWHKAIEKAGFTLEKRIDSGLTTVKGKPGLNLVHYICKKEVRN